MFFYGCNTNPDYQANLELAKKWVQVFENGDIELWKEIMSEDLRDQAPLYGMGEVDYATSHKLLNFISIVIQMLNLMTLCGCQELILEL